MRKKGGMVIYTTSMQNIKTQYIQEYRYNQEGFMPGGCILVIYIESNKEKSVTTEGGSDI